MPRAGSEFTLHAATLGACFALPLLLGGRPDFLGLLAVGFAAFLHFTATTRSDDPFLSTARVSMLGLLTCANVAAYGMSDTPALPSLGVTALIISGIYVLALLLVVARGAARVSAIDLEYFQYSLPSKRLTVDLGRRNGRLDSSQAALRLQLFVKEGLQFRRLSRVCRLLTLQAWAGLAFFAVFGFREPWHLLLFGINSLMISASATSIAARATLHPGKTLDNDWVDDDDDDDLIEDDDPGEYRPRRRYSIAAR